MTEKLRSILIVDDSPANLRLLGGIVSAEGYQPRLIPNGPLAMKAVQTEPPDLILLDVGMPGMSGYEVCARLKADAAYRRIPIIFISALGETEDKVRAFETGGVDYVTKPFRAAEVAARIRTHLTLSEMSLSLERMNAVLEEQVAARTAQLAAGVARLQEEMAERRAAEEQVRQLNRGLEERIAERTAQVEEANRELEAFADSVSHDLRAPLRAIDGFSAKLLKDHAGQVGGEGRRLVDLVRANVRKMSLLVDDLLALSRTGRATLASGRVEMEPLVRAALAEAAPDPGIRARIGFRLGELPDGLGSEPLLRQVWINLLSNAVKFSGKTERPEIEVEGCREGGAAVYRVRDNGAGFDPKEAGRLFGAFQRLHSQEDFEGTGLGLALVERIVRRHGGRVWADGAPGAGATFSFSIPAAPAEGLTEVPPR